MALGKLTIMPQRIQRKRSKGWKAPAGVVYVGRPSKWGNPFNVADYACPIHCVEDYKRYTEGELKIDGHSSGSLASALFKAEVRHQLRGKDLMCWCPEGQPCHADVLLEIANS